MARITVSEAVPMTIDPQYTVGFSWARQYGARVVKNFGNKFWLAVVDGKCAGDNYQPQQCGQFSGRLSGASGGSV